MRKFITLISALVLCSLLISCGKENTESKEPTALEMQLVSVSASNARINITYTGVKPHYVRIMKAVSTLDIVSIPLEDKEALSAFINTRSILAEVPKEIFVTRLESMSEYISGVVSFNSANEITDVTYLKFTTSTSEDAIGDESGAGSIDIETLN
jgi:hypothetical protein